MIHHGFIFKFEAGSPPRPSGPLQWLRARRTIATMSLIRVSFQLNGTRGQVETGG